MVVCRLLAVQTLEPENVVGDSTRECLEGSLDYLPSLCRRTRNVGRFHTEAPFGKLVEVREDDTVRFVTVNHILAVRSHGTDVRAFMVDGGSKDAKFSADREAQRFEGPIHSRAP